MNFVLCIVVWLWGSGASRAAGAPAPRPNHQSVIPGQTWPMFRGGPALLGVAGGSLQGRLELLWSFKTGGSVRSSAAIEQDRAYIGSDDGNVYGLDLAGGKKLWGFKTAGPV